MFKKGTNKKESNSLNSSNELVNVESIKNNDINIGSNNEVKVEELSSLEIGEINFNNNLLENDDKFYKSIFNDIDTFMKKDETPIFSEIEIETINRCNGTCSFCPVNKNDDKREFKKMSEELFKSIINQLKEINYGGAVGLYSNNEPLLDKRLIKFAKFAKEQVPNAHIFLYTNGTLLTLDNFNELILYLDSLLIDNYSDENKLIPSVKIIKDYCMEHPELKHKVLIIPRSTNEVLSSRGGEANNRNNILDLKSSCSVPFSQFVIHSNGTVPLCCCDVLGQVVLGDVNKEKIVDIWNNDKYNQVRKNLYNEIGTRNNQDICKNCDLLLDKMRGVPFSEKQILHYWEILCNDLE